MSLVGGIVGGWMGSEAQKDATRANRDNVQETNKLNLDMFRESRGSRGSAVMPTYMNVPGSGGQKFEPVLARDLVNLYRMAMPNPKATLKGLKDTRAEYMPMVKAAHQKAGDIFDGDIENTLLANYEPVQEARETLGNNRTAYRRQAAIDSLQKTLAEIDAVQAGKGYSGDSLSRRMMEFEARKVSADDESAARLLQDSDRLLTAEEIQAIKDYARVQLPLASINMPAELLAQQMGMTTMPQRELLNLQSARMQPLTFLRIGAGQPFQHMPMPLVNPVASPWQLLAQGTAQAGNMAADYMMKRDLQQTGYGPVAGPGGNVYYPQTGPGGVYYQPMPLPPPQANTYIGGGGGGYDYFSNMGYGSGTGGYSAGGYVGDVNIPTGVGGQV